MHLRAKNHSRVLEETVRELEASREVIRLKTLEEQKKSEQELLLAQETQESLLPRCLPQFENFRIHAFNSPTRYVGGDFYDFLQLSSGEWVGVLADVSGKGMSAALLSSMVLGALSMEFRSGTEPQEVLNRVNLLLCEKSLPYQFVTLFLFLLSPDGSGQFISAGHNPAYLFRSATGKIEQLVSDLFVLGMFDSSSYQSRPLHLMRRRHSGGVFRWPYGRAKPAGRNVRRGTTASSSFGKRPPREVDALEQKLLKAIEEFTQGTPQTDDITFVVVGKCSPHGA